MHRCFVDPGVWTSSDVSLAPEEHHHLTKVMRAAEGDVVSVFDGRGREATARIEKISGSGTSLSIISVENTPPPEVSLVLIQALPKGKRTELIVEKATELGATTIVPVVSEHAVLRLDSKHRADKRERWQRIAVNAARQCGTRWVPEIRPVCNLEEALDAEAALDLVLLGHLGTGTRPLNEVLEEASARNLRRIGLLVGPEGDWSNNEIELALARGAESVSFGPRVLRVETAAIFGLSILAYRFLDRG